MSIIALDLGQKRIGVAKSDGLGLMSHALPMIEFKSDDYFAAEFGKLLEEYRPEKVIVGYPVTLAGEVGIAAQKIEGMVEGLRKRFPDMAFELVDERLTTKEAEMYLRESGQSKAKRKARVDSLSAQILLQTYLDSKRN